MRQEDGRGKENTLTKKKKTKDLQRTIRERKGNIRKIIEMSKNKDGKT